MSTDTATLTGKVATLDETMLAMDVVDTLRRRQRLVEKELDESGREQQLKEQLKKIYSDQGLDVPDHIIEEGVRALKEERFIYKPEGGGLARKLATLYVKRGLVAKWAAGIGSLLTAAGASLYFAVIAPYAALPDRLAEMHAIAYRAAETSEAKQMANNLLQQGKQALDAKDTSAVRETITDLTELRDQLAQEYTLRVVNRPGKRSGVWRVPNDNPSARNYYLIVEGLNYDGDPVIVKVTSEEDGKTRQVRSWGLRVEESTFNEVAADKRDDGIIENDRVGVKRRGNLSPDYEIPTTGGAITEW